MKKCISVIVVLFISYFATSQSIVSKISTDVFKEPREWHHVLSLDDGTSVLFLSDMKSDKYIMKHYDKDAKLLIEKPIWDRESKKERLNIAGIFEINKAIVVFLSHINEKEISFHRIIIDPNTGDKIVDEKIFNYSGLDGEKSAYFNRLRVSTLNNYFFDFTKNDSLKTYYFMSFVKMHNTSELKILSYSYEHKLNETILKPIEEKYNSASLISSIQDGKDYYCAINYEDNKAEKKPNVVIYKAYDNKLENLSYSFDTITDYYQTDVTGKFIVDSTHTVKIALTNSHTYKLSEMQPDIFVIDLGQKPLSITKKYGIKQTSLQNEYEGISNISNSKKPHILNSPLTFYKNFNGQDVLVFQSYYSYCNKVCASSLEDIGIFEFNNQGKIINSKILPLKYGTIDDVRRHLSFLNDDWKNGKKYWSTSDYKWYYPQRIMFKHIEFIHLNNKTLIFFNDHPKNLDAVNSNDAKGLKNIPNGNGMVIVLDKKGATKSSIFNIDDKVYFDFSSGSYNSKTAIYSVLAFKDGDVFVTYLNLK